MLDAWKTNPWEGEMGRGTVSDDTVNDAVKDLARQLIERAAPEESAGFETQARAWFDDPERARRGDSKRPYPLGSGVLVELVNHTPLAMYIAQHVVSAAVNVTFAATMRRSMRWIGGKRRRGPDTTPPQVDSPLDGAAIVGAYGGDFERIRETALSAAAKYGAEAEQAELYAQILVAVLTEAQAEETPAASAQ